MADQDYTDNIGEALKATITFAPEEQILRFFGFDHLRPPLRDLSSVFAEAAVEVVNRAPRCAERTVALRKLLEGKDAAVRALLP